MFQPPEALRLNCGDWCIDHDRVHGGSAGSHILGASRQAKDLHDLEVHRPNNSGKTSEVRAQKNGGWNLDRGAGVWYTVVGSWIGAYLWDFYLDPLKVRRRRIFKACITI
ncbi:hypothetical protein PM082_013028 [Marasmius tenuissimus]|nr:hypothetical protein PM082_013028 [Marasmius tenuissimus]